MAAKYSPTYLATQERCVLEQAEAADSAMRARTYRDTKALFGRASQEQREAAYHHEMARVRLERLIDS